MTAPYRVLVTGSRDWDDEKLLRRELSLVWNEHGPVVVVHGACPRGADAMAARWVALWEKTGLGGVTEEPHPAEDHGPWPQCGPIRNRHMVSLGASLCLAFISPCTKRGCRRPRPHGSHGATGCADMAQAAGITVRRWPA